MAFIDDNITHIDIEAKLPLLSAQRRERVLAIRNEEQRRQSVAAYLLLCHALATLGDSFSAPPVFAYNEHGKPFLKDHPDVHFSMSHCHGAVAVAIASSATGIDIERIGRYNESLVRHTMNDTEQQAVFSSSAPQREFIRLWTKKEAVLKMTGEGLSGGLKDAIALHPGIQYTQKETDEYICAVCSPRLSNIPYIKFMPAPAHL